MQNGRSEVMDENYSSIGPSLEVYGEILFSEYQKTPDERKEISKSSNYFILHWRHQTHRGNSRNTSL